MSFLCGCCFSSKSACGFCSLLAALFSLVESLIFTLVNVCLIFMYTCLLKPPDDLSPGLKFADNAMSWFLYDEKNCLARYSDNYTYPVWMTELPENYSILPIAAKLTPRMNYIYQVIYSIFHLMWFFASLSLLYGIKYNISKYILPWIICAFCLVSFDFIIGGFYIKLMMDSSPGWPDGGSMFTLQFVYFRAFIIEIVNLVFFIHVANFYCITLRNQKKRSNKGKSIGKRTARESKKTSVTLPTSPPYSLERNDTNVSESQLFWPYQRSPSIASGNQSQYEYSNPAYQPTDPYEIEGYRLPRPILQYNVGKMTAN